MRKSSVVVMTSVALTAADTACLKHGYYTDATCTQIALDSESSLQRSAREEITNQCSHERMNQRWTMTSITSCSADSFKGSKKHLATTSITLASSPNLAPDGGKFMAEKEARSESLSDFPRVLQTCPEEGDANWITAIKDNDCFKVEGTNLYKKVLECSANTSCEEGRKADQKAHEEAAKKQSAETATKAKALSLNPITFTAEKEARSESLSASTSGANDRSLVLASGSFGFVLLSFFF